MQDAHALVASGLAKRFNGKVAVDDVDLVVKRGECVALLGPNGAGKTTTVEMLEGLQPPDAGRIEVCGLPLPARRREIMERVGVQLQETTLYKRYTVRETLTLFASFFKHSEDPNVIMNKLQLSDKADAQLRTLSGGQKQRVYLGCALINNPELLFLDEPTTGLDPQARRAIWDLLADVKSEGRSVLLTTHYMEEAERLADRVAIIDHGKIIAEDSPQQLIRNICGEQVLGIQLAALDGSPIASQESKQRIEARLPWFRDAIINGEQLSLTTAAATRCAQELFTAAPVLGLSVQALTLREGTLEDVFLKLTGRSMRDA